MDNFYFRPQITLLEKWFGLGINAYWDDNDTATYFTLCIGFLNISINLNMGRRKS